MKSYSSSEEYCRDLHEQHSALPRGFRVASSTFAFQPEEASGMPAEMTMTLITPTTPTLNYAAVFTKNAFPGAPVQIGKEIARQTKRKLGAIVINNKISNVCAKGGGVSDSMAICRAVAKELQLSRDIAVLPSSTGIIGWRLPVTTMKAQIPELVQNLQDQSLFEAAKGIMTTDLYPKLRSTSTCGGRIVGTAKGAGMIEPNMATMLSFILTDVAVPQYHLRLMLADAVKDSFNCISVDSDESTSDTVVVVSSNQVPFDEQVQGPEFHQALRSVCKELAEDVVRNGEGVRHVMRVKVTGAPSHEIAQGVGKAVINSPLFKCAVAGNDPNVGRLISAIGKFIGRKCSQYSMQDCVITIGEHKIFEHGAFLLNDAMEKKLVEYFRSAELYAQDEDPAAFNYPVHDRAIEISIQMGSLETSVQAQVVGADLTKEYVAINADYRS